MDNQRSSPDGIPRPATNVTPIQVTSQAFPAHPSFLPGMNAFIQGCLDPSTLTEQSIHALEVRAWQALQEAIDSEATMIVVSCRTFPDYFEIDILRTSSAPHADPFTVADTVAELLADIDEPTFRLRAPRAK